MKFIFYSHCNGECMSYLFSVWKLSAGCWEIKQWLDISCLLTWNISIACYLQSSHCHSCTICHVFILSVLSTFNWSRTKRTFFPSRLKWALVAIKFLQVESSGGGFSPPAWRSTQALSSPSPHQLQSLSSYSFIGSIEIFYFRLETHQKLPACSSFHFPENGNLTL